MVPRAPRRRYAKKSGAPKRFRASGKRSAPRRRYAKKSGAPKRQIIQANLGGLSITKFSLFKRPTPQITTLKKVGSPNMLNLSYSWSSYADGGTQGASEAFMCARNDLMRIWATIQSRNIVANSNLVLYPTGEYNPSWRYVLEHASQVLHFSNSGPTPVNIELYDIVARRNGPIQLYDLSGSPLTAGGKAQETSPILTWDTSINGINGSGQATTATGFTNASQYKDLEVSIGNLGASPTNSDMFNRFFKVVKRQSLSLPIGGQHKHIVNLTPNKLIKHTEMAESSTFAGTSVFTLVVHQGVPSIGCNSGGPPIVTTSSSQLSFVQTLRYKWTFSQDTQVNTYVASYLPSNTATYQSVQPSLVKVNDVTGIASVTPSSTQYVLLPSECTR